VSNPKLCIDCTYYRPFKKGSLDYGYIDKCLYPIAPDALVTGEAGNSFCTTNRTYSYLCGEDAKWFEPRPVIEPAGVKKPFWKFWQQNAERGSQ
jgi:hypothetical protein